MMADANYYDPANHEAASKIVGQGSHSAKYSAKANRSLPGRSGPTLMDFLWLIRFNGVGHDARLREKLMKKLLLAILLISSPAWAQTKPFPKGAAARVDNCAPIGRTEDGKLVYSMKCENLPAPPPPPPQAETREVPAQEPEVQRSGIFGWSYERKRPGE
jgi:hypothetical protein